MGESYAHDQIKMLDTKQVPLCLADTVSLTPHYATTLHATKTKARTPCVPRLREIQLNTISFISDLTHPIVYKRRNTLAVERA